ncbi:MAG: HAMP domain-containing histidine kinase [Ktedonobacteraceae bacterium]|nr:HAMP domain-containing histidine kinase [Ktedonobacteraceae bacterium]
MTVNASNTNQANILSLITHELRSPLNTINGYLDLALSGAAGELNEQLREFLVRSRAASEHLYMLLENLLLIARADAGQWRLNRDLLNLQDVVLDAVDALQLTAADQGITVTAECADTLPLLYADSVRLQQMLHNLLSNALRFTQQGGQVTVCAQLERNSGRCAALDEYEQVVVLRVCDSGCGIAPEYQQHIFERFFQLPTDVGQSRGQGLGLTAVKMIVEQHGGSVIVESSPGRGSTFICILPCLL